MTHRDMAEPTPFSTVVEVLRSRARQSPEKRAYTWLRDGEREEATLTFAECDLAARRIASALLGAGLGGQRALLLFPPGLDFVQAFFGCLYAEVVAVPAYPPNNLRSLPRLRSIASDSRPGVVLTTGALLAKLGKLTGGLEELADARWIAVDELGSEEEPWQAPAIDGDSIAFLQYTSGSTSAPKGVMVSHGNLLHNEHLIRSSFGVRGIR